MWEMTCQFLKSLSKGDLLDPWVQVTSIGLTGTLLQFDSVIGEFYGSILFVSFYKKAVILNLIISQYA